MRTLSAHQIVEVLREHFFRARVERSKTNGHFEEGSVVVLEDYGITLKDEEKAWDVCSAAEDHNICLVL